MTNEELVALAKSHDLDVQDLMTLFSIPPERMQEGGIAELIDLVVEEGDDPEIMAQEIRLAGWLVIGAGKD